MVVFNYWNCPDKWFRSLSVNWNCPDNWFQRLSIDVWCFQLTGIVRTNDLGDCISIGIVLKIIFTGCLLIGIAWTIDVWCNQLIGIVHTNDLADCLIIGIVPKIVFHRLSVIDWICLNKWLRVKHNWFVWDNCWKNCFRRSSINWNYPDNPVLEGSALWKPAATLLYTVEYNYLIWSVHYSTTLSLPL